MYVGPCIRRSAFLQSMYSGLTFIFSQVSKIVRKYAGEFIILLCNYFQVASITSASRISP